MYEERNQHSYIRRGFCSGLKDDQAKLFLRLVPAVKHIIDPDPLIGTVVHSGGDPDSASQSLGSSLSQSLGSSGDLLGVLKVICHN